VAIGFGNFCQKRESLSNGWFDYDADGKNYFTTEEIFEMYLNTLK